MHYISICEKPMFNSVHIQYTLLEKFWRISLSLTDDATAKLYVAQSLVKERKMVENFVTRS